MHKNNIMLIDIHSRLKPESYLTKFLAIKFP